MTSEFGNITAKQAEMAYICYMMIGSAFKKTRFARKALEKRFYLYYREMNTRTQIETEQRVIRVMKKAIGEDGVFAEALAQYYICDVKPEKKEDGVLRLNFHFHEKEIDYLYHPEDPYNDVATITEDYEDEEDYEDYEDYEDEEDEESEASFQKQKMYSDDEWRKELKPKHCKYEWEMEDEDIDIVEELGELKELRRVPEGRLSESTRDWIREQHIFVDIKPNGESILNVLWVLGIECEGSKYKI